MVAAIKTRKIIITVAKPSSIVVLLGGGRALARPVVYFVMIASLCLRTRRSRIASLRLRSILISTTRHMPLTLRRTKIVSLRVIVVLPMVGWTRRSSPLMLLAAQLVGVRLDKFSQHLFVVENPFQLGGIEGEREPLQSVDADVTFVAQFDRDLGGLGLFERLVLGLELLNECKELLVRDRLVLSHGVSHYVKQRAGCPPCHRGVR